MESLFLFGDWELGRSGSGREQARLPAKYLKCLAPSRSENFVFLALSHPDMPLPNLINL